MNYLTLENEFFRMYWSYQELSSVFQHFLSNSQLAFQSTPDLAWMNFYLGGFWTKQDFLTL